MSGVPYWDAQPRLWDVVKIGGITMPGVATPSGGIGRKIDTVDIEGDETGGTQTELGYEGARVTIRVRMWTQSHLDAYAAIVKKYRPRKGEGKPKPVDVIHPALAIMEIRALTIERLSVPEPTQEPGIWEAQIDALEFISEVKKGKAEELAGLTAADTAITGFDYAAEESVNGTPRDGQTPNPPATPSSPAPKLGPPVPPSVPSAPPSSALPPTAGSTIVLPSPNVFNGGQ